MDGAQALSGQNDTRHSVGIDGHLSSPPPGRSGDDVDGSESRQRPESVAAPQDFRDLPGLQPPLSGYL